MVIPANTTYFRVQIAALEATNNGKHWNHINTYFKSSAGGGYLKVETGELTENLKMEKGSPLLICV